MVTKKELALLECLEANEGEFLLSDHPMRDQFKDLYNFLNEKVQEDYREREFGQFLSDTYQGLDDIRAGICGE